MIRCSLDSPQADIFKAAKAFRKMPIANDIKNDIKAAKKVPRLPWWGILCGIIGSALGAWLFDHFGRLSLFLPTLNSVAVLGFTIALK